MTRDDVAGVLESCRGITPEEACQKCAGWGVYAYGSTATWRGGVGGQTVTSDVCDRCWGSGHKGRKWPSHRAALRAPAVTGEAELRAAAQAVYEAYGPADDYGGPYRQAWERLRDALAAPPAAVAPPALVTLVQEYQDAHAAFDALPDEDDDEERVEAAGRRTILAHDALLAWSPAPAPCRRGECPNPVTCHHFDCVRTAAPAPVAPALGVVTFDHEAQRVSYQPTPPAAIVEPCGRCGHSIEDHIGSACIQHCRHRGCSCEHWQRPAPPAVAGGDAPEKADDMCECGHTRKAHCWTDGKHRCYHGRCQCWSFGRRRQEGQ